MLGRRNVAALVAEFLGTAVLTLLTLSAITSQLAFGLFIALSAGAGLAVVTFAFASTSGGYFNPALTLGAFSARRLTAVRTIAYILFQVLGAFAALHVFEYITKKSATDFTQNAKYSGQILTAQIIGTSIFTVGWVAALYQRFTPAASAAVAGLSYAAGIMIATTGTLGLLNPALALGVKSLVWSTYVLGPVLAALITFTVYRYLFAEPEAVLATEVVAAKPAVATKPARATATATTKKVATKKVAAKKPTAKKKPVAKKKK